MRSRVLLLCLFTCWAPSVVTAQFLGFGNDRSHPELHWVEFETPHFILIYPSHLEKVARRAAHIAEQVYGPITAGLEIEMSGKIAIVLSDEDQIINGFALPGKMFIWVNLNDYPMIFGGNEHWLRGVIAHEFQHNVWFEAAQDWLGILGLFGTPAWFVEGLAEYETEEWGAERSDLEVREKVLVNHHDRLDPHDVGFSKVRYMADQYGDSTLVRAVKKRNSFGLSNFAAGFKESAGVSLGEFNEEWRRVATAHTYALFSQKESVASVGEHVEAPAKRLRSIRYSPNGEWRAVLFRPPGSLPVLAVVKNDSTKEWHEVDHGLINDDFAFDSSGERLVYAKFHRSHHGSLSLDLKVAHWKSNKTTWITSGRRASHPHWSPTSERIVFTAIDDSTTNLYTCDARGEQIKRITNHEDNVQVMSPRFSPNGLQVVFAKFAPGRGIDLNVLDLQSGQSRYLTQSASHDLRPIWGPSGQNIFFTSDRNPDEVPNLFTVPVNGNESDVECMTDVGESLQGHDLDPGKAVIIGLAMASTDTVRLRAVSLERRSTITDPVIAPRFTRWRDRVPPNPLVIGHAATPSGWSTPQPYRAFKHMRPFLWYVLPSFNVWGLQAGSLWYDRAHQHQLFLAGSAGYGFFDGKFELGAYGSYQTNQLPFGLPGWLTLSGGVHSGSSLMIYGEQVLVDQRNSIRLLYRKPFNFGERLYANHNVEVSLKFQDVEVEDREDLNLLDLNNEGLPLPLLDYRENTFGLAYRYTKRKPGTKLFDHAQAGRGLLARFDVADGFLGSDLDYRKLDLDASAAAGFPMGSLWGRLRYEHVWGGVPTQDFVGLRADPPLFPRSYQRSAPSSDLLKFPEHFFLRGLEENIIGDQAVLTTLEWRMAMLPPLPVAAFGFAPGGLTAVLFYDHGRVWNNGKNMGARHTVGWELRLPLRFGRQTLVVPSFGEGQTLKWEIADADFRKNIFIRLAMVQPF